MASDADLPCWISTLSGNTSDKTHFRDVVTKYAKQLAENDEEIYFIMDCAWYSEENIRQSPDIVKWISRVPESIAMAKLLLIDTEAENLHESRLEGYRFKVFSKTYADKKQQWVVVFSQQSFDKEIKTLHNNIEKENTKVKKDLWHFRNKEFSCEKDALKMLKAKEKKWKYHKIHKHEVIEKTKSGKRGRPHRRQPTRSTRRANHRHHERRPECGPESRDL